MKYKAEIFVSNDDIRTVEVDAADPAAAYDAANEIIKAHFHSGASVITVEPSDASVDDEQHFSTLEPAEGDEVMGDEQ